MTDLEQDLRSALHEDAARARLVNPDSPPAPEARPLPLDPPRPRPVRWVAVAAAVVVVALVAAAVLFDDDQNVDTTPPVTQVPDPDGSDEIVVDIGQVHDEVLQLATYGIDPDVDPATPLIVTFDIADEGWGPWIGATKIGNGLHVNLSITTVTNVVRDACLDHAEADPAVGPSIDDLATALSQLAPFEVTARPADVTLFGYPGKHLELTVPDRAEGFSDCGEDRALYSWVAPALGGAYHGYNGPEAGLTEEFWILDVDGTRLVIETNTSPDAPAEWIDERQAIIDSIQIHP